MDRYRGRRLRTQDGILNRTAVLQIPAGHPYVERCTGDQGRSPHGTPSPALDTAWLAEHHREFDAVHLHFGFEHLRLDELAQWVDDLARYRLPLVYTVHDLRNPHQDSPEPHDRHLDVLIPAAAVVITLTAGAAQQIQQRWGRAAHVVAHPYVIDPADRPTRPPSAGTAGTAGTQVVGIHLKDLRRNIVEPDRVVEAACEGALAGGGRLRVDLHPGALARPELARTRALARQGRLDLAVHGRFSDQQLAAYLAGLDVCVLPHRFGTHSGWLEACRDVGTAVVGPSCGFYADQWHEVTTYRNDELHGLDGADLSEAVRRALARPAPGPVDARFRRQQLDEVRAVHTRLYAELADRSAVTS